MKTTVINFRDVDSPYEVKDVQNLIWQFCECGINFDNIYTLSLNDDLLFYKLLSDLKERVENLIILDNMKTKFNIKDFICKVFDTSLDENTNAKSFIDIFNRRSGETFEGDLALLPIEATIIPNMEGAFQGYMLEDNDFSLIVLPEDSKQNYNMCKNYVLPYFEKKYSIKYNNIILKVFDVQNKELERLLKKVEKLSEGKVDFKFETENLDTKLCIRYDNSTPKMLLDEVVRIIAEDLKDKIYAEDDISLEQQLFNLLALTRSTISVAESFTGGNIVKSLVSVPGVSEFLHEGIVAYSNQSKKDRLYVREETLSKFGAVSSETAYEMALGLLMSKKCNISIATTGIAGPKSDNTEKPVGLCYIAVGSLDGIHVYKYNLTGNREEITQKGKNIALFLAIKGLKSL